MIEVVTIDTPSLGDRTYLATDGACALVIDPQRDIDRVLAEAAAWDVAVTHVFETHIHNDYVSVAEVRRRHVFAGHPVDGDFIRAGAALTAPRAVRALVFPGGADRT